MNQLICIHTKFQFQMMALLFGVNRTRVNISIQIYTSTSSYLTTHKEKIKDNIQIINTDVFHDRYIIIDDITYNLGTSVNSIGKKRFTISKLEDISIDLLLSNINKKA